MMVSSAGSAPDIICRTDELTSPIRLRNSRQSDWP